MYTLPIKSTDRVLEIGSGHNPHPRSDILCDRFLRDNQERQRFALRYDRPLVIAKGEELPFANNSFDFVLCSQVLEHTKNPHAFAKEISRVGRAGLIIVPEVLRERLFGWHYHHWLFYHEKNKLWFLPKKPNDQTAFAHFTHTAFRHFTAFRRYVSSHDRRLNIYYFWKNKINLYRSRRQRKKLISDTDKILNDFLSNMTVDWQKNLQFAAEQTWQRIEKKWVRYKRKRDWDKQRQIKPFTTIDLLGAQLQCMQCKTKLVRSHSKLICLGKNHEYPIVQGIPIMLTPREFKVGH